MTLVLAIPMLVALVALAALVVDFSAIWLARNEMRMAADAAALAGSTALGNTYTAAQTRALDAMSRNRVAGQQLTLVPSADVEFGIWDPHDKTFEKLTGNARNSATTIRIIARRTSDRGTALPTIFGRVINRPTVNLTVEAIATRGQVTTQTVPGGACPWLAGMPNGSKVTGYDGNPQEDIRAPQHSPLLVSNLRLVPGTALHFRQTTGTTSYTDASDYGPDGQLDWVVRQRAANGINATTAPLMALVGIFLDDRRPDTWGMAPEMDFTTPASRNFSELRPALKQVFYIGDGLNSNGELQRFIVPQGATRFYLGIMDEKGWWWDNTGQIQSTMIDGRSQLVK